MTDSRASRSHCSSTWTFRKNISSSSVKPHGSTLNNEISDSPSSSERFVLHRSDQCLSSQGFLRVPSSSPMTRPTFSDSILTNNPRLSRCSCSTSPPSWTISIFFPLRVRSSVSLHLAELLVQHLPCVVRTLVSDLVMSVSRSLLRTSMNRSLFLLFNISSISRLVDDNKDLID